MRTVIEHRCLREVPQVVLHEPEERIGDRVVVEVVGEARRVHPAHLEPRTVGRRDHHRFAAAAQLELALESVPHRRNPDGPGRLRQPREAGHQPTGAADEAFPVGGLGGQVDRRPVGGHDRVEVLEEPPGVLLDRQHRYELTLRGGAGTTPAMPSGLRG